MVAGDPETVPAAEKKPEALDNTASPDIRRNPPSFTPHPDNKRIVVFTLALFWPTFRVAFFCEASLILASIFFGWPSASVYVLVGLATSIALVPWNTVFSALVTLACLGVAIFTLIWYSSRTAGDQNKSSIFRAQESEKVDPRTTRNLTLRLFLGLAIIWACAILFAPWLLLLALMVIVFLSALRYWYDHPYSMGRVLGGITVGTLLLTAFMLRIWLDVNLWQTTGQNGMKFGEIDGAYRVEIPQRILVGSTNQFVQIVPAAPAWGSQPAARAFETYLQSPLAAPPAPAGMLAPLTATLPSGLPILAAIDAGPPMSIVVSPPSLDLGIKYGVAATSTFTTNLSHNLQYAPCEQVSTGLQQFMLWTDVILGDRCRWSTATLTVTLAAAEVGPRFPISATTELETIHGGRLRQFVTSNAVTQSPLLFFIPSLLAALAYIVNQLYVKEREQNAQDVKKADEAVKQYFDILHEPQGGNLPVGFQQISDFYARKLVSDSQWHLVSYCNMLLTEPVLPPWDNAHQVRLVEALGIDPQAVCGALQLRSEQLRNDISYLSIVEHVCTMGRGLDRKCSSLLTLYITTRDTREQIKVAAFVSPWSAPSRLPLAQLDLYAFPDAIAHTFSFKVGAHNPFRFADAEDEYAVLGPSNLFWPDHPCRADIERFNTLALVCGVHGAGKSALAYYIRSKRVGSKNLAVYLPYLMDPSGTQNCIAQDVLKIALANVSRLSLLEGYRTILVRFLVETLGAERVILAIEHAKAQLDQNPDRIREPWAYSSYLELENRVKAAAGQAPLRDTDTWLTRLNDLAFALDFEGSSLVIDNVVAPLSDRELRYLRSLSAYSVGLLLFTSHFQHNEQLENAGFHSTHLTWQSDQLCEAICYRLNYLQNGNAQTVDPQPLKASEFPNSFFTSNAWARLCTEELTPGRWFSILSYVLEHSSHAGRIDDDQIIQAINAT